jgi:radical SAM superfamily enzyme YgiQ (UPF0313 family)
MKKYGTDRFIFKDSTFTLNKDLINDLLDFFIKSNISIKWGCNTRVDMINEDLLKKMKSAGCEFISYGAESGDNETLIKLSKGIKIEQVEEAINLTKKYGMETICYFMIGFPWENKKMMEDSVKKALSINVDRIVLSSALPLPLTELENLSKKIDWLKFDSKTYVDGSINLTKFRDEEYEELYNSLSRKVNFYNKKKKIFNKIKYIKMELLKGNFKVITQELKRRKWFH